MKLRHVFLGFLAGCVVGSTGVLLGVRLGRPPEGPWVTARFVGLGVGQIHRNPFGTFELTNHTRRHLDVTVMMEAPTDPDLPLSLALSSQSQPPDGVLAANGTWRLQTLIASHPDMPFRCVVACTGERPWLNRYWYEVCRNVPPLAKACPPRPPPFQTVTSEWFVVRRAE